MKDTPEFNWIDAQPISQVNLNNLSIWKKLGSKSSTLSPESRFCDAAVYDQVWQLKDYYSKLAPVLAQSARARSNPFERIENGIFQNRAGMKLANIDYDLGFELTDPRRPDGSHVVANNDVLHFVDLCAGPGGFSEYMLWRQWRKGVPTVCSTKGIGITLRNCSLDFKCKEFQAGPVECYEMDYGHSGSGDIYDPSNVRSFVDNAKEATEQLGVHLVLADGGIEVKKGQEYLHEDLCKQLYLAEFTIGLSVLRPGGIMVCKLFDTYSVFTVGLIFLIHLCFDHTTIYKPKTSRPQNSERYMICKYKREGVDPIIKYLTECLDLMWQWSKQKQRLQEFDIIELVPMEILKGRAPKDSAFFERIYMFNTVLAKNQIAALQTLKLYVEDSLLQNEEQQMALKAQYYEEWQVPLLSNRRVRNGPKNLVQELTSETVERLWTDIKFEIEDLSERTLRLSEFEAFFKSPYDWRIVIVQGNGLQFKESRGFYMSQGSTDVFRYQRGDWVEFPLEIELPKDTLVYGEIVSEFKGMGYGQKREVTFHIIDALVINGVDVRNAHYVVRHEICTRLAKSVNKKGHPLVRAKQLVRMENIADVLDKCNQQELKGENGLHWTCPIDHTDERSPVIKAAGIMFLKITKQPWMMSASRESGRKYWFNVITRKSLYEIPADAVSTFVDTMQERVLWRWDSDTTLDISDRNGDPRTQPIPSTYDKESVHSEHFLKFTKNFCRTIVAEVKTPNL